MKFKSSEKISFIAIILQLSELTPNTWVIEKAVFTKEVYKFSAFYAIRSVITLFTRAYPKVCYTLSCVNSVKKFRTNMFFSSKFFYRGKIFLPTRETLCACQCFQISFFSSKIPA